MSWDVTAVAGFLCGKDAVLRVTIKGTLHTAFLDKRRVNNEVKMVGNKL
jgi:hypothetical protein